MCENLSNDFLNPLAKAYLEKNNEQEHYKTDVSS